MIGANGSVVVTGIGVVSPLSPDGDKERFWSSLCAGECAVREIRSFDASPYSSRVAAEIDRSVIGDGADPARWMARLAFRQALDDAGFSYGDAAECSTRIGLVAGTVLGGIHSGLRRLAGNGPAADDPLLKGYPLPAIADMLAREAAIEGPVLTVSTACASGSDAIGIAARRIARGEVDVAVAGGFDAICEFSFSGFHALKALTQDLVRPFSRNRTGLALGDGAAFIVMERAAFAKARGARPYGYVAGYAALADAVHLTAPDREGRGLTGTITACLRGAGLPADAVDYINAHGTGTLYNDWMECKAIDRAMEGRMPPVSSIKGAIGHTFGGAGAIEAAACLLAIRDGTLPPTLHREEVDPGCDIDCIPDKARPAKVRAALSLSAGFGGQNAALLFLGDAA